jgi:hypothetical protein
MAITILAIFSKQLMPLLIDGTRHLMANISTLFGFTESRTKRL